MKWRRIKDNVTGAAMLINDQSIDYIKIIDSKNSQVVTVSGQSFEVNNEQLEDVFRDIESKKATS